MRKKKGPRQTEDVEEEEGEEEEEKSCSKKMQMLFYFTPVRSLSCGHRTVLLQFDPS